MQLSLMFYGTDIIFLYSFIWVMITNLTHNTYDYYMVIFVTPTCEHACGRKKSKRKLYPKWKFMCSEIFYNDQGPCNDIK